MRDARPLCCVRACAFVTQNEMKSLIDPSSRYISKLWDDVCIKGIVVSEGEEARTVDESLSKQLFLSPDFGLNLSAERKWGLLSQISSF